MLDGGWLPVSKGWGELEHGSSEYAFAAAVVNRAEEIRAERMSNLLESMSAAVQVGVARAFGAKI